jgi:hypothetical protein
MSAPFIEGSTGELFQLSRSFSKTSCARVAVFQLAQVKFVEISHAIPVFGHEVVPSDFLVNRICSSRLLLRAAYPC